MFSQGAGADVPCTLLHFMGGDLIDVAKDRIVQSVNPMFHGKPMPPITYRVQLVRVLPGCDDLLPPFHPAGADKDDVMTLSACLSWPLLWPKSQIRLGAGDTTPQTTQPVVPAPSHGKTATTLTDMHMAQDPDMHMAQVPDDDDADDGTFTKVDKYFAEHGYGEEFLGPPSQEPNPAKVDSDLASTAEKPNCNRRCMAFSFEETPPAATFTEPQIAEVGNIISPNTLKKVVSEQLNWIPLHQQKKGRKRKTNKGASQPALSTIRALDGPPSPKDISRRVHLAGRPMLPTNLLSAATGAMRSLHDSVLCLEKRRLFENNVAYPVFVAKVPEGKGFVDSAIGGMIVLWFVDIFAMFNLHSMHYTFVRLFSLSMEMRIIRDKTPDLVIVDPFYMRAKILGSAGDWQVASSYLEGIILINSEKDNFLVPYFPW
ncbi:hypothetical protein ZWY2020_057142 [Hordeum vulgare]|nr:hypothetical protein ZWY2020_057142 [Hordeum vulgare]